MYQRENITLKQLFEQRLTKEKSLRALRARAEEEILVPIGELASDGITRYYDKQLSVIRVITARDCKNKYPKIAWRVIAQTYEKLDSRNHRLNDKIIELLNKDQPEGDVIHIIEEVIINQLSEGKHLVVR